MDRDNVKQLTLVALFAALVTVSIYLFRIPSFDGKLYFHLGETMMIAGAFILGKRNGALAAGIGSALADMLLGAPYWAPISFIIHGAQAWAIAALSDGKLEKKDLIAMGVGAVIVILGYCIAAWNIYGWAAVPMEFVGDILYNLQDFEDAMLDLLDAIGKGFSACEIIWAILDGKAVPIDLKWRHQKKFC